MVLQIVRFGTSGGRLVASEVQLGYFFVVILCLNLQCQDFDVAAYSLVPDPHILLVNRDVVTVPLLTNLQRQHFEVVVERSSYRSL